MKSSTWRVPRSILLALGLGLVTFVVVFVTLTLFF